MPTAARAARLLAGITLAACVAVGTLGAASRPAARARHAMIAGPDPIAVEEGIRVLRQGGNAVDAAVTMAFVLAVTFPQAGNIGGGGYLLAREPDGSAHFIDYREVAPAAATRDMFLDESGEAIPGASTSSRRAAGVPGSVAGLALALRKHGTIPWRTALGPAIRLARSGFTVSRGLEAVLEKERERLARHPSSVAIFFRDGAPLKEGDRLIQKDLAATLETLRRDGPTAFYEGSIAAALATDMERHGGLVTRHDLAAYRPLERTPLSAAWRSWTLISAPPSSSGGIAVTQVLRMLEPFDLAPLGHNSSAYIHVVSEAMRRAFADRAKWLGDPAFTRIPVEGLISPAYAAAMMRGFDPHHATPASTLGDGDPTAYETTSTTHVSIVDEDGMAVANTTTLNDSFGCGAVAGGLGFLLNNEMDDFSIKPGVPNLYGLVGGEANSIAPGKRMLSSMTPAILTRQGPDGSPESLLVLGSPGGSAIITTVLQTLLNLTAFGMELQAAVDAPRFHHQWSPDRLRIERGMFPADVIEALSRRGHEVEEWGPRGDVQAILVDRKDGWLLGASDARGYGTARGY